MRLPAPLPKLGPVKARWLEHQKVERIAVMLRAGYRCEGCGRPASRRQWAHLFGRRHLLGEPWTSSRHLTAALCCYDPNTNQLGCHERVDRYLDKPLRHVLEVAAATRFYEAHKSRKIALIQSEPVGAIRRLIKKLEKENPNA